MSQYSINEHKHAYAAWTAATAARASKLHRFNVNKGRQIIERVGLNAFIEKPEELPEPEDFDLWHRKKREEVIEAGRHMCGRPLSHGVAAKLINTYLKGIFICGGYHDHRKCKNIHPPIDSLLLKKLKSIYSKELDGLSETWSKFDSDAYENTINRVRAILPKGKPFWAIEEHWRGFQ